MISSEHLTAALMAIAATESVINPTDVTEDLVDLATVWPDQPDFDAAVDSTVRAIV